MNRHRSILTNPAHACKLHKGRLTKVTTQQADNYCKHFTRYNIINDLRSDHLVN